MLQKSLFLQTLLCNSSLFLFYRNEDNANNKNYHCFLMLLLLITVMVFLLKDNGIFFLFGIIKKITCFSQFKLCFETQLGHVSSFLAHKTLP